MLKKIISIFLIIITVFTFCACDETEKNPSSTANKTAKPTSKPTQKPVVTPYLFDEATQSVLNKEVSFSADDFLKFREVLDFRVTFPDADLFGILEEYEQYKALPKYVSTHENYFADGKFTSDELYKIVTSNIAKANLPSKYVLSDEHIRYACDKMAPFLEKYGVIAPENDARLLSEKLSMLVLCEMDGFGYGAHSSEDNRLYLETNYYPSFRYDRTIIHETCHIIQSSSNAEQDFSGFAYRSGYCYCFSDDFKNQPLGLRLFFEGSAETITNTEVSSREDSSYNDCVEYLDMIKLATLLDSDAKWDTFECLSLYGTLEDVFAYFNCETEEDNIEVLNMLCAMNYAANMKFCNESFMDKYEAKYGTDIKDREMRIRYMFNTSTVMLSRIFYSNLVDFLQDKTLTVDELFTLITLYEHKITSTCFPFTEEVVVPLINKYTEMQSEFFNVFAQKLGMTVPELQAIYDSYFKNATLDAHKVAGIDEAKATYMQYITDTEYNKRYRSVNQYKELLNR